MSHYSRFLSVIFSQFLVFPTFIAAAEGTIQTAPTLAGPVAAYSYDEGSGTNVSDASGHGNDGVISGATWTSQGRFGNGLNFLPPSWVTVNDSNSLDSSSALTL